MDPPLIDQIPFLGEVLSGNSLFIYLTVLIVLIMWTLVYRTPQPLARASGEHPATADRRCQPGGMRWQASLLCGAFCGLAGAQLALGNVSMFSEGMSNSRGYVAFACVIFGAANPGKAYWRR